MCTNEMSYVLKASPFVVTSTRSSEATAALGCLTSELLGTGLQKAEFLVEQSWRDPPRSKLALANEY